MALLARFSEPTDASQAVSEGALEGRKCNRCKDVAVAVCRQEPICTSCLLSSLYRKVRQVLHDSPAKGHSLAIAYSGGSASRNLLSTVRRCMDAGRKVRVLRDAAVIHVESSVLFPASSIVAANGAGQAGLIKQIALESLRSGFHTIIVPIEALLLIEEGRNLRSVVFDAPAVQDSGLGKPRPILENGCRSMDAPEVTSAVDQGMHHLTEWRESEEAMEALAALRQLFASLPDVDARQDLLAALTHRALVLASVQYGFPFLATAETADCLASKVFASVCKGKGYGLPLDTAPADYRYAHGTPWSPSTDSDATPIVRSLPPTPWYHAHTSQPVASAPASGEGVVILRPMIDIESHESVVCCQVEGSVVVHTPDFLAASVKASVDGTVAGVLAGLQRTYASTVHNVVRTTRKLRMPPNAPLCLEEEAALASADADHRDQQAAIAEVDDEENGDGADDAQSPPTGSSAAASAHPQHEAIIKVEKPSLCSLCGSLIPSPTASETGATGVSSLWRSLRVEKNALCKGCQRFVR